MSNIPITNPVEPIKPKKKWWHFWKKDKKGKDENSLPPHEDPTEPK